MNKKLLPGIVITIITIALIAYGFTKLGSSKGNVIGVGGVIANGTYCYGRVQEATTDAPYHVEEHIALYVNGGTVTGLKSGVQNGPDMTNGYSGTLNGVIHGNMIEAVYGYTVEGSNGSEEQSYSIVGDQLIQDRYQLHDDHGVLVPDTTTTKTSIVYTSEPCHK